MSVGVQRPGLLRRKSSKGAGGNAYGLFLLQYDARLVAELPEEGGALQHSPAAAPIKGLNKDAAGHRFHELAKKQSGLFEEEEAEASVSETESAAAEGPGEGPSSAASTEADDKPPPGTSWKRKGKKKKGPEGEKKEDLYALLGLANERWTATDKQIKDAYRRMALEAHPDKAGAATADPEAKHAIEERFKLIQVAYETLSDPARRREVDSTDAFDDTLPADCAPADFFKVFGPAFRRNARWSQQTPVPEVGDEAAPLDAVERFYDFWFTFRSWREFPHPDEEDVEQAECREERRWIERYNAKLREGGKKEERRRLKEFVEDAYRCDPRVIAHRERQRAERERKKREKEEERVRKEEEAERARAAEAAATAEAEAAAAEAASAARKERQTERKAVQRARARLRQLCAPLAERVPVECVETLCSSLSRDDLEALNEEAAAPDRSDAEKAATIQARVERVEQALYGAARAKEEAERRARAAERAAKRAAEAQRAQHAAAWSDEEVRLLEKALNRFPAGTARRWEAVAAAVRTRTVDEVVDMVKHGLKAGRHVRTAPGISIAKKRQANTTIHSEATQRLEAFTDVEVNLSGAAAQACTPGEGAPPGGGSPAESPAHSNGVHAPGTPNGVATPRSKAAPMPDAAQRALSGDGRASSRSAASGAASPRPGPAAEPAGQQATEAWSETQEVALVQAVKRYGKDVPNRWDRVAAAVEGQDKASCMRRFKELRESFRAKKKG